MKFWMLTGDKIETAINIGFSCSVLDQNTQIIRIEQTKKQELHDYLTKTLMKLKEHQERE